MNLNQQLESFLTDHFRGLPLKQPLFYHWRVALRFDLQCGEVGSTSYFTNVVHRACTLFNEVFESSDPIFFVLLDYRFKRRKIRFKNFSLQRIGQLKREDVHYRVLRQVYSNDKDDVCNRAVVLITVHRLDVLPLLTAIAHKDFPGRCPQLGSEPLSSKDIYLVNINKRLIFHMYDDRGLDILAEEKSSLAKLYRKYNNWLLAYNKQKMDTLFRQE